MKKIGTISLLLLLLPLSFSTAMAQDVPEFIDQYCVKCHNFEDWAGSLDMEGLDFTHVDQEPQAWEKMIKKRETIFPKKRLTD